MVDGVWAMERMSCLPPLLQPPFLCVYRIRFGYKAPNQQERKPHKTQPKTPPLSLLSFLFRFTDAFVLFVCLFVCLIHTPNHDDDWGGACVRGVALKILTSVKGLSRWLW